MSCAFNSPPVLAEGDGNRINAIHNTLVMRSCPVLVKLGKAISVDNLECHLSTLAALPGQLVNRDFKSRHCHTLSAEV